jgi:hypothetical protein
MSLRWWCEQSGWRCFAAVFVVPIAVPRKVTTFDKASEPKPMVQDQEQSLAFLSGFVDEGRSGETLIGKLTKKMAKVLQ